ncbi:MAG: glycosyltransferase [Chlorobium sp.]|nr:glycosyltransferase [Chlorobium sp.]
MLTVLHIIESLADFGGTPRKLLYLSKYLDPSVCRQIFLCYLPSPLKDNFEQSGAVVECIDSTSPLLIIRSALRLMQAYKVDAVCTHFTRPLVVGYLAALMKKIPVIHNEHCSAHYRQGFGRRASRFILPRVQVTVCNSRHTLRSVEKEFNVSGDRLVVVHNPVEKRVSTMSRATARQLFEITDDELVVGHIGGMIPQRDQATLIEAFARFNRQYSNSRLILIGDGPMRNSLEQLALKRDLGGKVEFVGYSNKIGEYLDAFDIYANPTLDEGFGIAVVEAMLTGLPVVLSDKGAHPELIENGVSGILYRGGDSDSLAQALCGLAASSEMRSCFGTAAVARASVCFQPSNFAVGYYTQIQMAIESYARLSRKES